MFTQEHRLKVALLVESSNEYSRGVLRGIRTFVKEKDEWEIYFSEQGRGVGPPPWFDRWRGDGIIARIENREIEDAVTRKGVPVVNVSAAELSHPIPTVTASPREAVVLAVDHLLERGFRNLAYCGDILFHWSRRLEQAFRKHLGETGYAAHVFNTQPGDAADWIEEQAKLARWLRSLPKPVGLFTCLDIRGQWVLDVCRQESIRVPGEIAVLGYHNDELLCELCEPQLSSIVPNAQRAGYDAAVWLDELMHQMKLAKQLELLPPLGIVARGSTDAIALSDAQTANAIRFIRRNACKGIGVEDVLAAVPMSRTLLERRFQKYLQRSPYEEILRLRIERVKELLITTNLQIAEIAKQAGFSGVEYLSAMFKKRVGLSPRAFRRKMGVG